MNETALVLVQQYESAGMASGGLATFAAGLTLFLVAWLVRWEAALQRINRLHIKQLAEAGADTTLFERWIERPTRYMRTILISTALLQSLFVILVFISLRETYPALSDWDAYGLTVLVSAALLLVLGRVLPRNWGRARAVQITPAAIGALELLAFVYMPLLWLLEIMVWLFLKILRIQPAPEIAGMTEEEVRLFVEVSQKEGVLEEDEGEMMVSIVEFRDTIVKEVMTPRTEFECVSSDETLPNAIDQVLNSGHSRLPVYTGSLDRIDGVLFAKDLFRWVDKHPDSAAAFRVTDIMRPAIYVPETKNVTELLRYLQAKKTHLAVVVDEYGGTAGLVTIEDILEEIVGDIQDEYDTEEPLYTIESDGAILADAKLGIEQLAEELDIRLAPPDDEPEYESLGGFLLAHLGSVPTKGQVYRHDGYQMTVVDADERKVKQVRIERLPARDDAHETEND